MKINKIMLLGAVMALFSAVVITGCTGEAAPAEGGTTSGDAKSEATTTSTTAADADAGTEAAPAAGAEDDGHGHAEGESH